MRPDQKAQSLKEISLKNSKSLGAPPSAPISIPPTKEEFNTLLVFAGGALLGCVLIHMFVKDSDEI